MHHLSARIPNYKLQKAHDETPEFQAATRLTLKDTFRCMNLTLWDEDARKLIRFKDLRRAKAAA